MGGRERSERAKAVERWVLRAGALAAALASIAGVVTLVWPDSSDSPRQTTASLRKVVADPNISLREFSERQRLAATGVRGSDGVHDGTRVSLRLVAQTSDPETGTTSTQPEPPPTIEQPPGPAETSPEEELGIGGEAGVLAEPQRDVAAELEQRLPTNELPAGCRYETREGRIELVCSTNEALSWADDESEAGDEGTRAADAQRVVRVLRGTRTRSGNEPVGVSVNFTLILQGLAGVRTDVRWSLYDAGGGTRVPRDWLVNRRALTTRPQADSDSASGSFWVPLPRRPGPFFVRVSVFGPGHRQFDFADSTRFR